MAKIKKDEVPNPNSVANRDILQRMSFLYQASNYLNSISSSASLEPTSKEQTPPLPDSAKKARKRKSTSTSDLSRSYIGAMKAIGQKTVVKMYVTCLRMLSTSLWTLIIKWYRDPAVKRTLCKGCGTILISGSTATVRTKREHTPTRSSAPVVMHY